MGTHYAELDAGNGWVKLCDGKSPAKKFVHALRALRSDERKRKEQWAGGGGLHTDYIEVFESKRSKGSVLYSTGETALTDGFREFRSGAKRYTYDYHGVLALKALNVLFHDSSFRKIDNDNEIVLTVTNAPQDSHFAGPISKYLLGWHKVQVGGEFYFYNITHVENLEEPCAGLFCYTLDNDGKPYPKSELWTAPGRVLVLDIGSYTFNFQEADPNGVPLNEGKSKTAGVDMVKQEFIRLMRETYPDDFTNGDSITPDMVDYAFMNKKSGYHTMWGGGNPYECNEQVERASAHLMNEILSYYENEYRGGAPYGTVILDGGGCGLCYEVLKERLGHPNIRLAEKIKRIQFANVTGASKLRKMMVRKGYM